MSVFNKKITGSDLTDQNLHSLKKVNEFQALQVDYNKILLTNVNLEAAFINIVYHNLGRKAKGYSIINSTVPIIINFNKSTTTNITMEFTTTADCKCELVVF